MHEAQGNSGEMPLPERGSPFYPGLSHFRETLSSTQNEQYEHDFPPRLRSATPCAKKAGAESTSLQDRLGHESPEVPGGRAQDCSSHWAIPPGLKIPSVLLIYFLPSQENSNNARYWRQWQVKCQHTTAGCQGQEQPRALVAHGKLCPASLLCQRQPGVILQKSSGAASMENYS